MNVYNQKLINILLQITGWITIVGAVLFFVSGFFLAAQETTDAIGAVGYWLGYEIAGLAMVAICYVLLGILYKINNKK